MSTKRLALVVGVQAGLAALIVAALLVGNRSHPSVVDAPAALRGADPIVLAFDRPVEHASVEHGLTVTGPTGRVPLTLSWGSRSVAAAPKEPWSAGATYTVVLDGARDREGGRMPIPFRRTFAIPPARFLFLTPDHRIALYDLAGGTATTITAADERVISYDVAPDGAFILYAGNDPGDTEKFVADLPLTPTGVGAERVLWRGTDAHYLNLHICDGGRSAVAFREYLERTAPESLKQMVTFRLDDGSFRPLRLFRDADEPGGDVITCARRSDFFVYRDPQGTIELDTLGTRDPGAIGQFEGVYGFTPKEDALLLSHELQPAVLSNRMVYSVDAEGTIHLLTDIARDASYPAFNPPQTLLAVGDLVSEESGEMNPFAEDRITFYGNGFAPRSIAPPANISYEDPGWSPDGRMLTFDAVATDTLTEIPYADANDLRRIDGDIHLLRLPDGTLPATLSPEDLHLSGGHVLWVP